MAHLFNIIGRVAFVGLFIVSAFNHYSDFEGAVGYAASGNWHGLQIAPEHLPYMVGSGVFLAAAGALAVLGGGNWCGGLMIAAFLAGVTPVMHWPIGADGNMDQSQMIHFMKNLSMFGAALMIAYPPTKVVKVGKAKKE